MRKTRKCNKNLLSYFKSTKKRKEISPILDELTHFTTTYVVYSISDSYKTPRKYGKFIVLMNLPNKGNNIGKFTFYSFIQI